MSDSATAISTGALAELVGGELIGSGDVMISGMQSIDAAGPDEITFIHGSKWSARWSSSSAGAALVSRDSVPDDDTRPLIVVDNAELASASVLAHFFVPEDHPPAGIDASAVVDPSATIDPAAAIGPHVWIGAGVTVEAGAVLLAGTRVHADATIAADALLHDGVIVKSRCRIGERAILQSGVVIGTDGFGYRPSADRTHLVKLPHVGNVVIEADVEIGANACVDRGKFGSTVIGRGTKVDNLVQIGHNVRIGQGCLIASGVLIGGSVEIGNGTMIGGNASIKDQVKIGDFVVIGGHSGVVGDVPTRSRFLGYPARPWGEVLRQWGHVSRISRLIGRLTRLERASGSRVSKDESTGGTGN